MPEHARPREKLREKGPQALTDEELVAAILGMGTAGVDVRTMARQVAGLIREYGMRIINRFNLMRWGQDCYMTETLGIPARIPAMCRDSLVVSRNCVIERIESRQKNQNGGSHQGWQVVYGLASEPINCAQIEFYTIQTQNRHKLLREALEN
jgi:hypothetical protein